MDLQVDDDEEGFADDDLLGVGDGVEQPAAREQEGDNTTLSVKFYN